MAALPPSAAEWLARIMSPVDATGSVDAETAARLGRERVARARQERARHPETGPSAPPQPGGRAYPSALTRL